MIKKFLLFLLFVFIINTDSFAYDEKLLFAAEQIIIKAGDDPRNEKIMDECTQKISDDDIFHAYAICAEPEYDRLEKIMNKTYLKIMKLNIPLEKKQAIERAQKSWIIYREQFRNVVESYGQNANSQVSFLISIMRSQAIILDDLYGHIKAFSDID